MRGLRPLPPMRNVFLISATFATLSYRGFAILLMTLAKNLPAADVTFATAISISHLGMVGESAIVPGPVEFPKTLADRTDFSSALAPAALIGTFSYYFGSGNLVVTVANTAKSLERTAAAASRTRKVKFKTSP